MQKKYSNIFWHQGVKIFEDKLLKNPKERIKVEHLENDVTKAFINVLQHTEKVYLKKFLSLLDIKDSPDTFEFDFQVTDSKKFKQHKRRLMLSIISNDTPKLSVTNYYNKSKSIPDAAIHNQNTVILIEAKTQSPLVKEQIEAHKKFYLGSATDEKIISWEEITLQFTGISKNKKTKDSFISNQFVQFLEMIGVSEFNGFTKSDFESLGLIGSIPSEEYADYKRIFNKKVDKFKKQLGDGIELNFKNFRTGIKQSKVLTNWPGIWLAIYFHKDNPNTKVNDFPNINFNFSPYGIELSINSETQTSIKFLRKKLKTHPKGKLLYESKNNLDDYNISLYYKVQFLPQDNFAWEWIYGYPKPFNQTSLKMLQQDLESTEKNWNDFLKTFLFKIENGQLLKSNGERYSEKEIKHVRTMNPKAKYAIRINKFYDVDSIEQKKASIVKFFVKEIEKLNPFLSFLYND